MPAQKFKFNFEISASSKEEATAKVSAAATLCQKLTTSELTGLAKAIQANPGLITQAKPFLGIK